MQEIPANPQIGGRILLHMVQVAIVSHQIY